MPRLFALDHNFPSPIVSVLAGFQTDAELVRVDRIDPRLADLDDWELLLALHHHERPWDGLITTDRSMLRQPLELVTLIQTKLTLVVAVDAGHNPVKASGLLFAHLQNICRRTDPAEPQVWQLSARGMPADVPWNILARHAAHSGRTASQLWRESKLSAEQLAHDPLAS